MYAIIAIVEPSLFDTCHSLWWRFAFWQLHLVRLSKCWLDTLDHLMKLLGRELSSFQVRIGATEKSCHSLLFSHPTNLTQDIFIQTYPAGEFPCLSPRASVSAEAANNSFPTGIAWLPSGSSRMSCSSRGQRQFLQIFLYCSQNMKYHRTLAHST